MGRGASRDTGPWGHKELDMTKHLHTHTHTQGIQSSFGHRAKFVKTIGRRDVMRKRRLANIEQVFSRHSSIILYVHFDT